MKIFKYIIVTKFHNYYQSPLYFKTFDFKDSDFMNIMYRLLFLLDSLILLNLFIYSGSGGHAYSSRCECLNVSSITQPLLVAVVLWMDSYVLAD